MRSSASNVNKMDSHVYYLMIKSVLLVCWWAKGASSAEYFCDTDSDCRAFMTFSGGDETECCADNTCHNGWSG